MLISHRKWMPVSAVTIYSVVVVILGTSHKAHGKPAFKIVHLGDSYSAGNGARGGELGNLNYHGVSGCFRSPTNWGSQFAQSLTDVFAVNYINRACSGSVLEHFFNNTHELGTIEISDGADCPLPSYPDEEFYIKTGATSCSRHLVPQISVLDHSVDLVLMTIGGNDAQFGDIIRYCIAALIRSADGCKAAVATANRALDDLESRLNTTFAAIKLRLRPEAKVVLVAYPHLLLNVVYYLDDYDAGSAIRILSIRADAVQGNAIAAANAAAGAPYIVFFYKTKELFSGHEPDPSALTRNPYRWMNEFEGSQATEFYHYNRLGHQNLGNALSTLRTFGAVTSTKLVGSIDLAFVVDTTGSMSSVIAQVRENIAELVQQLSRTTSAFRVAIVSYRDFPQRTGDSHDYPSRVDQSFTNDLTMIQNAIDSLSANGGGDTPESVYSGIKAALDLSWRTGKKIATVIGDAPPLNDGDAEPISNLTAQQLVAASIALDPVQVMGVDVGSLVSNDIRFIVEGTGGASYHGVTEVTKTISEIINTTSNQPFAWFGSAISGKIGIPITFDAQGSHDPNDLPIDLFEWNFDGDGVFDNATTLGVTNYTYGAAFDGFAVLRVTCGGGTALASARVTINDAGSVDQGDSAPCKVDQNGISIITSSRGVLLNCQADNIGTDMPTMSPLTTPTKSPSQKAKPKSQKATPSPKPPKGGTKPKDQTPKNTKATPVPKKATLVPNATPPPTNASPPPTNATPAPANWPHWNQLEPKKGNPSPKKAKATK